MVEKKENQVECTLHNLWLQWEQGAWTIEKYGQSKTYTLLKKKKKIIHITLTQLNAYCLCKQSVILVCTDDSIQALCTKSHYLPPLSIVIHNLKSCTDNPHTGQSTHG